MVGIALLTLVPGQLGGSETYVSGLLRGLREVGGLDYRVFLPPVAPGAGEGLPAEVVSGYRRAESLPQRLAAMSLAAVRPPRIGAPEAIHYPLTIAIPRVAAPSVVTLHDVQHLDLPGLFGRAERAFRSVAWHRSVRGARLVVVPSAFVRDRAAARLGLDPNRVRVIHHGIDHERFTPGPEEREPLLLYPARRWAHKNHERLLEAFALIRREWPELRLVLTGGGHEVASADGVDVRGHVSADELRSLYRRASALVFPSRYEGFGQPPLEAMASGLPVASSNAASLPEIVGDAARLFDPDSAQEIAEAVLDVLADPAQWRARGLARAAQFTWERSARAHEDVYRELL